VKSLILLKVLRTVFLFGYSFDVMEKL
jgi:hypothetical protein